jgi:hypothetical protein
MTKMDQLLKNQVYYMENAYLDPRYIHGETLAGVNWLKERALYVVEQSFKNIITDDRFHVLSQPCAEIDGRPIIVKTVKLRPAIKALDDALVPDLIRAFEDNWNYLIYGQYDPATIKGIYWYTPIIAHPMGAYSHYSLFGFMTRYQIRLKQAV